MALCVSSTVVVGMAGTAHGAPGAARTATAPAPLPPSPSPSVEPARAGTRQRVAVVRVDFEGSVAEAARELFIGRLVEGLAAAQFEVISGAAVAQKLVAASW
jgi:hypothetical protein